MLPRHLRWTSQDAEAVRDRVRIRDLTRAHMGVAYQPIVDARSGALFAYEVLARCRLPELASPLVLFQRAVQERACGRLGRMIREEALALELPVPMFLNIHPDELVERWLVRPDDPLGFCQESVYLEITETAAFEHHDLCSSVLREVCARTRAKLVIDDFGAGHSNLTRLLDLEPAIVKLDLQLIRDVHTSAKKCAVVRYVTELCHELGAGVVAEGIETAQELACLQDLGIDYAQGYLIARPANPPPPVGWERGLEASLPELTRTGKRSR
ncbi:MAG TPA: EAL domain-containing protein [Polyangiaceae bacterium]|nr:EAL domain-containing protein [Polyangiaceae bacterium]